MPRFSANFRAALDAGERFVPVVTIEWPSGTKHYAPGPRSIAGLACEGRLVQGATVSGAVPVKPGSLSFPEGSIVLADTDGAIMALLEGGQEPRGSVVTLRWLMRSLELVDAYILFSGILDRPQSTEGGFGWELFIRANDTPLQGTAPKAQFLKAEFPLAPATTWGLFMPIVYGSHSADSLTGKGMVRAIPWCLDVTEGYRFTPTRGVGKSIPRVYKNGTLITLTTDYVLSYPIRGGKQFTSIDLTAAATEEDIITCDIDGLEDVGDGTGNLIVNPVDQLRHFLANFFFGDWRLGPWNDPADYPIDLDTFAASSGFAETFAMAGSPLFGGEAKAEQITAILQKWYTSWLCFRPFWTEQGSFGIRPIDHRFHGFTSPGFSSAVDALFLRGRTEEIGVSFGQGDDTSNLLRRVELAYLNGLDTDGKTRKTFSTIAVEDVSQEADVGESFSLDYSEARLV